MLYQNNSFVNTIKIFVKNNLLWYNYRMIETLKNTNLYNSLNLKQNKFQAYLFTSLDKELNNEGALTFAKSILCNNNSNCNKCFACSQFNNNSHPDLILINQKSIKVEDINVVIDKLSTLPFSSDYKVFVILNAENINEIAQNKLLKSLEEPSKTNIFILSTSQIDKLLPTVLSRLNKIRVPKLSLQDLEIMQAELQQVGIDVSKYSNSNLTFTDIINFETNENYRNTLNAIEFIFKNLNSSQDIPKVASSLPEFDKTLFFKILQLVFLNCIENKTTLNSNITNIINSTFPQKAIINSLPLVEEAYKKQMANVNFGYILDNLLFNILKEKFLCKQ